MKANMKHVLPAHSSEIWYTLILGGGEDEDIGKKAWNTVRPNPRRANINPAGHVWHLGRMVV